MPTKQKSFLGPSNYLGDDVTPEQWVDLAKFYGAFLIVMTMAYKAFGRWVEAMKDRPVIQDGGVGLALSENLQRDSQGRQALLSQLVENQKDTGFALKELVMMNKHRDTMTIELHRQTHSKLEEVTAHQRVYTENQERIIKLMREFTEDQRRAA